MAIQAHGRFDLSKPTTPDHQLAMVPLFENISSESLNELASRSIVREYPRGQILCNEGDPGDNLIVLEDGHLRITRWTSDGDEVVLAMMEAPAVVGELALLDGAPRDATVTAHRAVKVRLIPRRTFLQLLQREHAVVEGLLHTLAGLVRLGNERHADFMGLDVPGRLAKWLLRQAGSPEGDDVQAGVVVTSNSSQSELAAELGTTRSTLNRALHTFESLGIIAVNGNLITLEKPEKLVDYTW